jgi:hypothetical protein
VRRALAITLAAVIAGAVVPMAPAQADTGNPLDIGPITMFAPPKEYPARLRDYFARPDATKWGWAEQVLPIALADGRGQNTASAAIAGNCIPAIGEEPRGALVSFNSALLEGACRVHPGNVTFNVGVAHRGQNRDGDTYSTSDRLYFVRYSRTSDCKSPTVQGDGPEIEWNFTGYNLGLDVLRPLGSGQTQITRQIPQDKVGQYLCVAQGHTGRQLKESNVPVLGIDTAFFWRLRGPWTVYKIVGAGESDRPSGVTATGGNAEALVSWTYPDAQLAATKFTATSAPDGKTCMIVGAKTCLITGLRNGVAYTFTVTAERGQLRQTSDASAPVTPRDPNAGGNAGGNAGANAAPLTASQVLVTPVNSDQPQPLGTVDVFATLTGSLAANQQLTARTVLACFVANRGDGCGAARQVLNLQPVVNQQRVRVWIPRAAAGQFLRVTQSATTSTGVVASPAAFRAIGRNPAVGPARVDPPAGADPNANVPQQAGEAAPADGQGGNPAPADPGAANPAPENPQAAVPGAAPNAGSVGALVAAARVDAAVAPIVSTEGEGANGAQSLKLTVPAVQVKNKKIPLAAVVTPRTPGVVTFTLARVTPKGKWIIGKVKTATVNKAGKASSRWILEPKKPAGAYTVVASFVPKQSGAAGVTVTTPITVR